MKLLKYFLFVLLETSILLQCASVLGAMSKEIMLPKVRLIADLSDDSNSYEANLATYTTDSSDEETEDKNYLRRHKPYERSERGSSRIFERERSARIRSEKKRLITCSCCKIIHVVPETENFLALQKNSTWTCNDICWEADGLFFLGGLAVCAGMRISLLKDDEFSGDSESSNSETEKKNLHSKNNKKMSSHRKICKQVIYWISCTYCSTRRRVPTALVESGTIDMKKLKRKKNWICADAHWKGPDGFACKD